AGERVSRLVARERKREGAEREPGRPERQPKQHVRIVAQRRRSACRGGPCAERGLTPCLRAGVEGAPRCAEPATVVASDASTGGARCRRDELPSGWQLPCSRG